MRLIAALLLLSSTLFSHDIPSGIEGACLQGEPSSFIEGCVSAITGELFFFQDDLVVRGASPLTIRRRYTGLETQNPKLAWHLFHHTLATVVVSPVTTKIYVNEPNGTSMFYFGENTLERKKQNLIFPDKFQTVHESFAKGRTNTGQDFLGGQYHPKSNKIELRDVNTFKIVLSNGGSRTYEMIEGKTFFNAQQNRTIYSHQLKEERLANGHVLCFQYDEENRLKGVILKNPSKTKIFASYLAKRIDDEKNKAFRVEVTSSDKRKVIYHYQYLENNEFSPPLRQGEYLQRIEDGAFPNESFQYSNRFRKIKRRTLKDNRSIRFDLNKKTGKVDSIDLPREAKCAIEYKEKETIALDPRSNQTCYTYDPQTLRLEKIDRYQGNNKLLQTEQFEWSKEGELLARSIGSNAESVFAKRTYAYDDVGNVIEESFSGNITSKETKTAAIKRTYSDDGRNLLLTEVHPNGKHIFYEYLEGTNLPTAQFTGERDQILQRTVYRYNADNLLVEQIEDDGTSKDPMSVDGVHQRNIQEIERIEKDEFYGMAETIKEYYQDGNRKVLLTTTSLRYNPSGLIEEKTIIAADTGKKKVFTYEYDRFGNLTRETNPLHQVATYAYDESAGNLTEKTDFSGLTTTYKYDDSNNLILEDIQGHITKHTYNPLNQRISTIDHLGYKTTFTYDALGNLLTTTHPDKGTSQFTYDAAGNQTSSTDPNENITTTTYNAYGKPLLIIHPDGTTEEYTYTLSGEVESHTNQEGLTTSYTYDVFGRELTKNTSFDKEVLTTETKQYSGFQLLEETDPLGRTTHYQYDAAGRLIKKIFLEQETSYEYDNFNRQTSVTEQDTIAEFTYDCLDRVIEEKKYLLKDKGQPIYKRLTSYNAQGEIASYITYPDGQEATEAFEYDIWGRKIAHTDPLDRTTTIAYSNAAPLKVTTTDPKGRKTIETFDFRDQLLSRIQTTADHQTLSESTYQYDLSGNLIQSIHKRLPSSSKYVVAFSYDNMNRLIKETEQGSKTTKYSYTETGLLSKVTKPSKAELNYTYNSLGHLIRLHSSKTKTDESIDYTYEYNLIGELTSSKDAGGKETSRTLDDYCNVEEETLANGLTFFSKYDPYHRCIEFRFLGSQPVEYTYQGPYLAQIDFDSFTHTYEYDKALNLIKETNLLNNNTSYSLDLLGRPLLIDNNFLTQAIEYDEVGNITTKNTDNVLSAFDYDPLDQLTQEPMASYVYDSLHNRTKKNDAPYTLNPLNQIKSTDKNSYDYNPNGNLIEVAGADPLTIKYDALDRPIAFIQPEKTKTEYSYDAQHRRLSKQTYTWKNDQWVPTTFHKYLWQGDYEIGHVDQDGNLTYRVLGRTPFAEIGSSILIINNHQHLVPIHDIHGNVLKLINLNGRAIEERTFSAFGEGAPSSLIPWGFVSKRHDVETDLIYFGRRYYSPELGRFLTPDPEKFTDSYNLYQYTLNNPLNRLDPHGLTISMLPLSVPSYDEDRVQMSIGTISGVAQWTANTACDWAKYAGGIHGTEDMSLLETYNLHMQADASFRQSAARTIETTLGADLDSSFYQYSFQSAYMGADFAYAAMIPLPKFSKAGKAIQGARSYFKSPTAAKTTNVAAKLFSQSASKAKVAQKIEKTIFLPPRLPKSGVTPRKYFGGKTFEEMREILLGKFGPPHPGAPGGFSYFNSKTGRTFHTHQHRMHKNGKPHVDIRKRGVKGTKEYYLKEIE